MTDSQITDTIRRFLLAEKSPDLSPTALLLIIRLLVQHGDEKELYLGQDTLAGELNCERKTIKRTAEELQKAQFLVVRHRGSKQLPNAYSVNLERLPLGEARRTIVSQTGKNAAMAYKQAMMRANPKRRFSKTFLQRAAFVLQGIIDKKCGGDLKKFSRVLQFAFDSPIHRAQMLLGPHRFKKNWSAIIFSMERGQK
jgi:hypothetical protein